MRKFKFSFFCLQFPREKKHRRLDVFCFQRTDRSIMIGRELWKQFEIRHGVHCWKRLSRIFPFFRHSKSWKSRFVWSSIFRSLADGVKKSGKVSSSGRLRQVRIIIQNPYRVARTIVELLGKKNRLNSREFPSCSVPLSSEMRVQGRERKLQHVPNPLALNLYFRCRAVTFRDAGRIRSRLYILR